MEGDYWLQEEDSVGIDQIIQFAGKYDRIVPEQSSVDHMRLIERHFI